MRVCFDFPRHIFKIILFFSLENVTHTPMIQGHNVKVDLILSRYIINNIYSVEN